MPLGRDRDPLSPIRPEASASRTFALVDAQMNGVLMTSLIWFSFAAVRRSRLIVERAANSPSGQNIAFTAPQAIRLSVAAVGVTGLAGTELNGKGGGTHGGGVEEMEVEVSSRLATHSICCRYSSLGVPFKP